MRLLDYCIVLLTCEIGSDTFNEELYQNFISTGIRYEDQKEIPFYGCSLKRHTFFPSDESNYGLILDQLLDGYVFDSDDSEKTFVK